MTTEAENRPLAAADVRMALLAAPWLMGFRSAGL
jgi:hypothetical protein